MADAKLTALSAIGTLGNDDLFYVVDDPGGTPLSRKATGTQVKTYVLGGSSTDNAMVRWDGAGGAAIQNSANGPYGLDAGNFLIGLSASVISIAGTSSLMQGVLDGGGQYGFSLVSHSASANGPRYAASLSRHATPGSHTVVQSGDVLFTYDMYGSDGDEFILGAILGVSVAETPGNGNVPTLFSVTAYRDSLTEYAYMAAGPVAAADGTAGSGIFIESDTTNAVKPVWYFSAGSTGTPANNFGIGVQFSLETAADNFELGAVIEAYAKDVTSGSEDFGFRVKTMTAGQAAATSLDLSLPGTVYPQGHIFGLTMSNDAGDTTNDINITAGEAVDETGVWNMVRSTEMTKRIDATWAVGDDQGGMANNGTGVADTTWYEVLLIGREDTRVVDVAFSTTANRAVLPTSYTHKRRIGWVRRGASTNLQFTQVDDYVTWTTQVNDSSTTVTATASAITLTAPPSSIARFRATLQVTALAQANEIVTVFSEIPEGNVTPAGSTGIASLGSNGQSATSASNDWTSAGHFELRVSSTSTIEHDSALGTGGAGTFDISTFGFVDHRRRMSAT